MPINSRPYFSVVVPVYKTAGAIEELCLRLDKVFAKLESTYEVILVNDGCPQSSWEVIQSVVSKDKNVKGIKLSRNFGQHSAITAGLSFALGKKIVVMDCDLQDKPEEIENLYTRMQEGYDIVLAKRVDRQDSFFKKLSSKLFYFILSYLTGTKQDYRIANFGIYSDKVILAIVSMKEKFRFFPVMVRWVGFKTSEIDVVHGERTIGKSSYSFKKMFNLALDIVIAFSDKPLRIIVKTGLAISVLSFLYALYIFIRALEGDISTYGWASLIVSIWFLSGLLILIIGIIGLYIGRIFDESKKRPIFIIDEKTK